MSDVYIAHHGIKGQKWGVRRWQNKDGSLTPAGYDHYGVERKKAIVKKQSEAYNEAVREYNRTGDYQKYIKSKNELRYAKRELSDAKARAGFKEQGDVSKRQKALIEKYKKQGFTQDEAEVAAYKRDEAERIAKAALGVSVAALAAYGAYKYADYAFDKTISTKDVLYRVAQSSDKGVHDAFYAVFDKSNHDKKAYNGLYAQQLKSGAYGRLVQHVYEKKIGVNSNIKMASRKHAKELLAEELLRGDNLRKAVSALGRFGYSFDSPSIKKLRETGKIDDALYDIINRTLPDRNLESTKIFYKALRDAGYGAVKDINDAKYSGFGTRLPVIIFDSAKVSVRQVNELKDSYINKQAKKWASENEAKKTLQAIAREAPYYSLYAGIAGASAGAASYQVSKQESEIVRQYRSEHPKSELSKNEILRNYYNKQG